MINIEEIKKYAGDEGKKFIQVDAPEIRFNGEEGKFVKNYKNGEDWTTEEYGKELKAVVLRIRRKLSDFKNKISSVEHQTPNDTIYLFGVKETGNARELRTKYQGLKTQQLLYSLNENDELIKVNVRGSSLGSENKPKDSIPLYEYLGSFEGNDHIWMYETKMIPKEEKGKLGTYYAIHFERGEKLNEERMQIVGEKMKYLYEIFLKQDAFNNKIEEKKENVIDYEKEDTIDAKDVPF